MNNKGITLIEVFIIITIISILMAIGLKFKEKPNNVKSQITIEEPVYDINNGRY